MVARARAGRANLTRCGLMAEREEGGLELGFWVLPQECQGWGGGMAQAQGHCVTVTIATATSLQGT